MSLNAYKSDWRGMDHDADMSAVTFQVADNTMLLVIVWTKIKIIILLGGIQHSCKMISCNSRS